jgi:hypothetical protein
MKIITTDNKLLGEATIPGSIQLSWFDIVDVDHKHRFNGMAPAFFKEEPSQFFDDLYNCMMKKSKG